VHKESLRGVDAYQRSISASLAAEHAKLSSLRADVRRQKQSFSTALNLSAVDLWLQTEGYQKTCQAVQNLSITVRDLYMLENIFGGDDGVAAAFEHWQQRITTADSQSSGKEMNEHVSLHLFFQETLSPQLQRFRQQLDSSLATLTNLPNCLEGSSLFSTVQSQLSMAKNLMSQCQLMLQLGGYLVTAHVKWLKEEVAIAIRNVEKSEHGDMPEPELIWDS